MLRLSFASISHKDIAGVNFVFHFVEHAVISVGDNNAALAFKLFEIVDDDAAKERFAVFQCRFVDYDGDAFGTDAFHNALDGTLAEVVGVRFHGQAVHADSY